ncbi:MAG: glycosyltransferase N-terminal domain-containing protein [Pseudomonadota bacterium]
MPGSSSCPNPTFLYKALSWILFPAVFIYTSIIAIQHKNSQYFLQRLGFFKPTATRPIWCHCASVGEIKTALPLFENLISQQEHLVVSTNTTSGLNVLLQADLKNTTMVFFPLDYTSFAKNFIRAFSPKLCVILETELWPCTLLTTLKHSIPITIINGRISTKTLKAPSFLKKNYQNILANIEHIFTSSENNQKHFIALGAEKTRISILDNLKFSGANRPIYTNHNPLNKKFILCVSTHENEELQIIKEWNNHTWNDIKLVIAIRHPRRTKHVCNLLDNLKLNYSLHSKRHSGDLEINNIYIIDTVGELAPFIQYAELIFMGGSLIPNIGGHNILEAAKYGKCILNGPYYQNFSDIIDEMQKKESIIIIENADDLIKSFKLLIDNVEKRTRVGNNAKLFLLSKCNVAEIYAKNIFSLANTQPS